MSLPRAGEVLTALRALVLLMRAQSHLHAQGLAHPLPVASGRKPHPEEIASLHRTAALVQWAAHKLPTRPTCLCRALVTLQLLETRGIGATLQIGVRRDGESIDAHAWVECDGIPIGETNNPRQRYVALRPLATGVCDELRWTQ